MHRVTLGFVLALLSAWLALPAWGQAHVTVPFVTSRCTGCGTVLFATKHLTGADIATIFSSPVEVVSTPGLGKVINPIHVFYEWDPGVSVYTAGDAYLCSLAYGGDVLGAPVVINAPVRDRDSARTMALPVGGSQYARASTEDQGIFVSALEDPSLSGAIVTATIDAGGSGYVAGDTVHVAAGNSLAILTVTTVSAGAVTGFTVTDGGAGYIVDPGAAGTTTCCSQPGAGTGFQVVITSISAPDGDLYVTLYYTIATLH